MTSLIEKNANSAPVVQLEAESLRSTESVTLWKTAMRRLFKRKSALVGMGILGFLIVHCRLCPTTCTVRPDPGFDWH